MLNLLPYYITSLTGRIINYKKEFIYLSIYKVNVTKRNNLQISFKLNNNIYSFNFCFAAKESIIIQPKEQLAQLCSS